MTRRSSSSAVESALFAALVAMLGLGCARSEPGAPDAALSAASAVGQPAAQSSAPRSFGRAGMAAIAHGGVGSPIERSPAVMAAVRRALERLGQGDKPLDAAVAGAVVLEDDPSFNAGTGANVRFDGVSVQMDAAVMDSSGRFGAVAVIERVKNPVRVARAVIDTPHSLIAGDGATAFARALGFADYDPATADARKRRDRAMETLEGRADAALPPGWEGFDWRKHYDYQRKLRDAGLESSDTIGVLVRGSDGSLAGALSTGGTTLTLRGRVGDVPLRGAGLFVGEHGAVAATGNGEDIVREQLARRVYERMAGGEPPDRAIRWGLSLFPEHVPIGLIALSRTLQAAGANRAMAWAARDPGGERMPTAAPSASARRH
jgi:L-asparaginase / beta-aspartyl-peptidase